MLLNNFHHHVGALLISSTMIFNGFAVVCSGQAAADSTQDERFLADLGSAKIPPLQNASSLIASAHKVCGKIDSGMAAEDVVEVMKDKAFEENPAQRLYPADRVRSTLTRFITAAVHAYCPDNGAKVNF